MHIYRILVSTYYIFFSSQDSQFDSTTGFLGKTMEKLKILSRGSQTKLLCYMMLFSLFVFFVIYWIIKLRWCRCEFGICSNLNSLQYHFSKKNCIKTFLIFKFYGFFHWKLLNFTCFIHHTREYSTLWILFLNDSFLPLFSGALKWPKVRLILTIVFLLFTISLNNSIIACC